MLQDIKRSYEKCADTVVPNWRKINKNELANLYVQHADNPYLTNGYFSALICRYWSLIDKNYAISRNSVSKEDCYDWLVRALQYALEKHKWTDPKCSVYRDPSGPDKVIHRVMMSTRQMYYQSSNTSKRRGNYGNSSIDAMVEAAGDAAPLPEVDDTQADLGTIDIRNIVTREFNRKNYITAFIVDGIINYDTFEKSTDENGPPCLVFSSKKLAKHLHNLDNTFSDSFAERFDLNQYEVQNAVDDCVNMSRGRLKTAIKRSLSLLSRNKALLEMREYRC